MKVFFVPSKFALTSYAEVLDSIKEKLEQSAEVCQATSNHLTNEDECDDSDFVVFVATVSSSLVGDKFIIGRGFYDILKVIHQQAYVLFLEKESAGPSADRLYVMPDISAFKQLGGSGDFKRFAQVPSSLLVKTSGESAKHVDIFSRVFRTAGTTTSSGKISLGAIAHYMSRQ